MIIRAIDANNDWLFGKGRNDYVSGVAALAEDIQTRLQEFLGDCFFASQNGIDWFNLLGSTQEIQLSLSVSAVILNTVGVTSLIEVSRILNHTSRNISITYTIDTIYGRIAGVATVGT